MNTIKCKDVFPSFHCPIDLEFEMRGERKFLTSDSLQHLDEHFEPDHKELKEQEEQTKLIEELI